MKSLCRASSLGSPHRTERPVLQAPWLVLGIRQTTLGRRVLQDHDQRRGGHRDSRRGHLRGRSRTSESKAAGSKDPARPPRLLQSIGPTRSREREAFSACDIAVQNDTTPTNTGLSTSSLEAIKAIIRVVSLAAGSRLGPYEIVAAIGAGGMGEVYKARDSRLDRNVA